MENRSQMHPSHLPDGELIPYILGGQWSWFEILVQRYRVPLYRFGLKMSGGRAELVEDVLQDTFMKAFENLSRFEGRSEFKTWIYRIFINSYHNHVRKSQATSTTNLTQTARGIETLLYHKQVARRIEAIIQSLPEKQKTAVILRLYEELPFETIAEIMGALYDTAKANFRHGLLKIKAELKKEQVQPAEILESANMDEFPLTELASNWV